jgi:tetratricopeptide (TPR) repeat protein
LSGQLYEKALVHYRELGDRFRVVSCLVFLGHAAQQTGDGPKARALFEQAMGMAEKNHNQSGLSDALRGLGRVALYNENNSEAALHYLARARQIIERSGGKHAGVFFHNELGEVARRQGDLERARRHYWKALELARATEAGLWAVPTLNLATIYMLKGRYDAARELLKAGPQRLLARGHRRLLGAFHSALCLCDAMTREWTDFDFQLERAEQYLVDVGVVDDDDARYLSGAAEQALLEGQRARAARAWRLSARVYRALSLVERALRVEQRAQAAEEGEEGEKEVSSS